MPQAAPARRRQARGRLDRPGIVANAIEIADEGGMPAVTMRAVAKRLGVEAMSLYNHVANRDDIVDGMVDEVFAEIALDDHDDWRASMRARAHSARSALRRHPWAIGLLDSRRSPGPATLRHHDAVLGMLMTNGFSVAAAVRAVSLIDSHLYGHVLQEQSLPLASPELEQVADRIATTVSVATHPHLATVLADATAHQMSPDDDYRHGLDLILAALERDLPQA